MAVLRHIAAIRARLLQSTDLVPILATTPEGTAAIYAEHIWSIKEPVFPCVTIYQPDANLGVWGEQGVGVPLAIDPGRLLIESFSKLNNRQPSEMDEFIHGMLHKQESLISTANACFQEIRKTNWNMAQFDPDTRAWRVSAQYLIRVFVS